MPSIGDISVAMGIDDSKWFAGAVRVQNEAKRMEAQLNGIGRGGGIGGNFGSSIGQAAFAVQDFTSVLAMGGSNSLSRALMSTMNNVQMLGAAFGPWAMAATAAAGALGSILIPKLLEGGNAAKTFSEGMGEAFKSLEKMQASGGRLAGNLAGIDKIKSSAGVKDRIEDIELQSRLAGRNKADLIATLKDQQLQGLRSGIFAVDMKNPIDPLTGERQVKPFENMWGSVSAEGVKAMEGIAAVRKSIEDITRSERDLAMERDHAGRALTSVLSMERAKAAEKNQARMLQEDLQQSMERSERASAIMVGARTPFESAQARLEEVKGLADLLGPNGAEKAADDILSDFSRGRNKDRANQALKGGEFGTAEGFSSIMASIRQDQGARGDEQVNLLKEQVAQFKEMLSEMRKQNKGAIRVEAWN